MKISLIIPTLNEEKLLPNLLQSIEENNIKQKYNAELIISDGGSLDNTISIALSYADKIIAHDNPERQTIAEGKNLGAEVASGDILFFLGSDVRFDNINNFFDFIVNDFANSDYVAMTCQIRVFPEEEKLKDKIFHFFLNLYFYSLNIFKVGMGRGECQIIRKEFFTEVGGFNPKLVAGEDFDFFKRVRKKGKILFNWKLKIYESPRRYRRKGYLYVLYQWFINSVYLILYKRSKIDNWEEVR
jgi:glycosyltransferase involved in cell wall biosynthesis